MLESSRRIHPLFALATLLGCAAGCLTPRVQAQSSYLWPGRVLQATEEVDSFIFQLGMACTAAVRADRLAELQELYAAGGPAFEAQDEYARNMLFYAAQEGSFEMIEWLLSPSGGRLGPVKHQSTAGRTPLELAAEAGREQSIMTLLGKDAPEELLQIAAERAYRKGFQNVVGGTNLPQSLFPEAKGLRSLAERQREKGLTEKERRDFVRMRLAFNPDADFAKETSAEGGLPLEERQRLAQEVVLLQVEMGRAPDALILERIGAKGAPPVLWAERGARAIRKAAAEHDAALEKLWPLAEKQGWSSLLTFRDLAILSASYRKPQNLKYALSQVDEKTMFTLAPGEPSLVEVVLEQLDLECIDLLRARYPSRDLLAGLSARQIFDRLFWDNVAPPPASWRPYLKMRAMTGNAKPLAWEDDLAALSKKRLAFLAAVQKLGANLSTFPPDDFGQVLKAILWLQDEALYRAMTQDATPAQLAYVDEEGWSLLNWERWCGIEGPTR